jgi:maltooligosyltrehalose trehalohydrolase
MDGAGRDRRLPAGAEVLSEGGAHFRVWAPIRKKVEVIIEGGPGVKPESARRESATRAVALEREPSGYFSGVVRAATAGTLYRYRLDGGDSYPDPASRFQPEGPHGPSQVIDPSAFAWTDHEWQGVYIEGQVIYEMHVGTFTKEGTWEAAAGQLKELADMGITVIEVMPIHEFPGRFGWGYDGVGLFAPAHLYGEADDFRRFVDKAHSLGVAVILDVVYNHLGPDGNYLKQYSDHYFTDRHVTDWGEAINFYDEHSEPVREFFISNAGYWVGEFHLDGLRLDATQNIYDENEDHILAAIVRRARAAARPRSIIIVGENEPQHTKLVRPPEQGGYGLDALWNDDFHHSAVVALTGHNQAYYPDYRGTPQEFISALKWGYLYQGQRYKWQEQRRGTPGLDLKPASFVTFIENHDQLANSGRGERMHRLASPGIYRAMTALMLLGPGTPMLFQGQEFAASNSFFYFADHEPDLGKLVRDGRLEFLAQFPSLALPEMQALIADPCDIETFNRSKLDFSDRERHREIYAMHRDLLKLRRQTPPLRSQRPRAMDGAVLSHEAFVLRFFGEAADDVLLVVNFGPDLELDIAPEPLLAPVEGKRWRTLWSSEDPRYGGLGTPPLDTAAGWRIPGNAAVALHPIEAEEALDEESSDGKSDSHNVVERS